MALCRQRRRWATILVVRFATWFPVIRAPSYHVASGAGRQGPLSRRALGLPFGVVALLLLCVAAWAAVSQQALVNAGMNPGLAAYASKISASEGNFSSVSKDNCVGFFQLCPGTFENYNQGESISQFTKDPSAQVKAFNQYEADQYKTASKNGFFNSVGNQACDNSGKCATITDSSIMYACQFGCGSKGKLAAYLKNGSCIAGTNSSKPNGGSSPTNDGNGTCVGTYLVRGAGYDVSAITNRASQTGSTSTAENPTKDSAAPAQTTPSKPSTTPTQTPSASSTTSPQTTPTAQPSQPTTTPAQPAATTTPNTSGSQSGPQQQGGTLTQQPTVNATDAGSETGNGSMAVGDPKYCWLCDGTIEAMSILQVMATTAVPKVAADLWPLITTLLLVV